MSYVIEGSITAVLWLLAWCLLEHGRRLRMARLREAAEAEAGAVRRKRIATHEQKLAGITEQLAANALKLQERDLSKDAWKEDQDS